MHDAPRNPFKHALQAPGILATDEGLARRYTSLGARFVAVGVETVMLAQATRELAARFNPPAGGAADAASSGPGSA